MAGEPTDQFWVILHSLIRPDKATKEEVEQADAACAWLHERRNQFRDLLNTQEAEIIGGLADHWLKFGKAPALPILKHLALDSGNVKLQEAIDTYEQMRDGLTRHPVVDLDPLLANYHEHVQADRTVAILKIAAGIAKDGRELPDPKNPRNKIMHKGPRDALRYVVHKVDNGVVDLGDGDRINHGTLNGLATHLRTAYDRITDGPPQVLGIGITKLDTTKPSKGYLCGILGYAKHGKTRLMRTWMYNLLCEGKNVMHVTYEQSVEEELIFYACMHSYNAAVFGKDRGIPIAAYRDGRLSNAQRNFLYHELIPDLEQRKSLPGTLCLRKPEGGWDEVKASARQVNAVTPLDALAVDYLTAVPIPGRGDQKEYYNSVIQDAKDFALYGLDDPLMVISPFQASRSGWLEAGKSNGEYQPDAIYMYSQVEKAVDILYYVYNDETLSKEQAIIVGTCVDRRGPSVNPYRIGVQHGCGALKEYACATVEEHTASLDEL